jgi:hypothetical protein
MSPAPISPAGEIDTDAQWLPAQSLQISPNPWRRGSVALEIPTGTGWRAMSVRARILILAAGALALAACGAKTDSAKTPGPSAEVRSAADAESPYAGQWATDARLCGDALKSWTIEQRRMGIPSAERFCFFNRIYINEGGGQEQVWSAEADCESGGKRTQAFVFFRLQPDWKQMRVTMNDDVSVTLTRCLAT